MKAHLLKQSLFIFLFISTASAQVTNGLQGYWPFDGNANDISGNNNNGTVFGATLSPDRFGQASMAYCFDGIDDYIVTAFSGVSGTTSRSISFWASIPSGGNAVNTSGHEIISYGDAPATGAGESFRILINRNCVGMAIGIGEAVKTVSNSTPFLDSWHHYIIIYNVGISGQLDDIAVYLDGVLVADVDCDTYNVTTVVNTQTTMPIHFGRLYLAGSPRYFEGCLDEVRMYNKPLSSQEIDTLFNNANIGIENEAINNIQVSVYPNPASNHLNINSNSPLIKSMAIYNTEGKIVYTSNIQSSIDISKYANGVYMISFMSENNLVLRKLKFIKN